MVFLIRSRPRLPATARCLGRAGRSTERKKKPSACYDGGVEVVVRLNCRNETEVRLAERHRHPPTQRCSQRGGFHGPSALASRISRSHAATPCHFTRRRVQQRTRRTSEPTCSGSRSGSPGSPCRG